MADGLPGGTVMGLSGAGDLLWIATSGGLAAIEPRSHRITAYAKDAQLPSTTVTCVCAAPDGVWAGTSRGACRLNLTARKVDRRVKTPEEADGGWINAIAATGQAVWLGTRLGLYRYDLATEKLVGPHEDPDRYAGTVRAMAVTPQAIWIAR